jgi:hypothetical protein
MFEDVPFVGEMLDRGPTIGGSYDGPPMTLEAADRHHVLVMAAPGGGWTITLDQTREARHGEDVFVTITRPSPEVLYPEQPVDQALALPVRLSVGVHVYARVLEYGAKVEGSYARAAASD